MKRISVGMTRAAVRAYAIRWLRARNRPTRDYRGLDPYRVHFECGCSITKPAVRRHPAKRPGFGPSKACSAHQRALEGPGL